MNKYDDAEAAEKNPKKAEEAKTDDKSGPSVSDV